MRVGSTFNVAFRALRRNKLRSALTALGIIIGVGAVIAMVGIGSGAKAQVEAQIASLGQNIIQVYSGSTTASGIRTGWGGAGTLKIEDALAIEREIPGVVARMLGFKTTSAQMRSVIDRQMNKLLRQGAVTELNGMLRSV